eukprot:sb/3471611/
MKFAELTQDVQVTRGQEVQFDDLAPGRRKNNILYQRVSASGLLNNVNSNFGFNLPAVPPAFAMPPFPSWALSPVPAPFNQLPPNPPFQQLPPIHPFHQLPSPFHRLPPNPPFHNQLADGSSEDKTQSVLAALHERQKIIKDALSDFEKRKERMRSRSPLVVWGFFRLTKGDWVVYLLEQGK